MQQGAVMMVCAMALGLFASDVLAERGTKAERLDRVMEGYKEYKKTKTTLAENEAFANQHPDEAKICFDKMMAVADGHGVERQVYFTDNQSYFRECIEYQLGVQQ